MEEFIFDTRKKISIINLEKTQKPVKCSLHLEWNRFALKVINSLWSAQKDLPEN